MTIKHRQAKPYKQPVNQGVKSLLNIKALHLFVSLVVTFHELGKRGFRMP